MDAPAQGDKPNVLLILVDQLRHDAFSFRGNSVISTPNIDQLAAGGAVFTDAICASPFCGPSRAALLSGCFGGEGRYAFANRDLDEKGPWLGELGTVDEALDRSGYHVAYHGKWHTGAEHRECYRAGADLFGHHLTQYYDHLASRYPAHPTGGAYKKDRYTGWHYRPWPVDEMMAQATAKGFRMPHDNEAGVIEIEPDDSLTAWTVKKTMDFLKHGPRQPFAVTCSILHPHAPLIVPQKYADMFDPQDMPPPVNVGARFEETAPVPGAIPADASGLGEFMALYYALVKELDDRVGALLAELERQGLAGSTLVILTSDHGELLGSHGTFSKSRFFEECLRVPLILRWPGTIPAGMTTRAAASGVDLAPTILDYCGAAPLEMCDGKSLRGVIEGQTPDSEYAHSLLASGRCVRSKDWKYAVEQGREFLFDLEDDPFETRNLMDDAQLSPELAGIRDKMAGLLLARS